MAPMKALFAGLGIVVAALLLAMISERVSAQSSTLVAGSAVARQIAELKGVGAIIEADVVGASYQFDTTNGPRTAFTLGNINVIRGSAPDGSSFTQFGGPVPNGMIASATELPKFNPGSHYIIFIVAGNWFYSPVWGAFAFRTESVGGREVVLAANGRPVVHFGLDGLTFGTSEIVQTSGDSDPLAPLAARSNIALTATETSTALDRGDFLASANRVFDALGGLSPTPISLSQHNDGPWNIRKTLSAAIP